MNKKFFVIYSILLVLFGSVVTFLLTTKDNQYILRETNPKKGTFKNALSMMLETDLDSGEYERSTSSEWPTEGYIFNKQLSKCENGGELDWDSVNNQVLMIGASSDKCYVYFDKYTSVVINNLSFTSTPTSITATVTATAGSGTISKYMFSINNGAYIESESNVHTFVGLNSSTEYSVSVKAIDSNGRESLVTTEVIETSAYVLPSITNVASTLAWNQIKVTVTAQAGTNNISKYYYSIDNSSYQESTSNIYTFTGLEGSTTHTIKIKVEDTKGKYSSEYTSSITTSLYNLPTITNLASTVTWNQIKVTLSASAGTNNVSKYYYSINNGTYQESTSNTYTFTGLSASTAYTIKTKVVDTFGRESIVRTDTITTTAYALPVITNLSSSATSSSITVTATATKGTGNISKYYYSSDGGSSYTESTSNNFTFSNLSCGTTYSIKVYIKDSNGKSSSIYTKNINTLDFTFSIDNVTYKAEPNMTWYNWLHSDYKPDSLTLETLCGGEDRILSFDIGYVTYIDEHRRLFGYNTVLKNNSGTVVNGSDYIIENHPYYKYTYDSSLSSTRYYAEVTCYNYN